MAELPSVAVKFDPDKIRIKLGGEHSLIRGRRVLHRTIFNRKIRVKKFSSFSKECHQIRHIDI